MLKLRDGNISEKNLSQDAKQIIIQANIQTHLDDDKNLEFLRDIDRARSY